MAPKERRRDEKSHKARYNYSPDTQRRHVPTVVRRNRGDYLSEQESSSGDVGDEDATLDHHIDTDRRHYGYDVRGTTARRQPSRATAPQQASRHQDRTDIKPMHDGPGQIPNGTAERNRLPLAQPPVAFQSILPAVSLDFVALDVQDDAGCLIYVELNPEVLDQDPQTFLTEAANALKARKKAYAISCLWKALLIRECEGLSARERTGFFFRLLEDDEMHERLRLRFKEAWLKLHKLIIGPHPPLQTPEPVNFQLPARPEPLRQSSLPNRPVPVNRPDGGDRHQSISCLSAHTSVPAPFVSDTRPEPPQQQSLPKHPVPVNQPNGGDRHQSSARTTNTYTLEPYAQFADSLADKRSKVVEEAKENPRRASTRISRSTSHPVMRPRPSFGTQWIDINAPKARENWPIKDWPYIPTLAFLDSGSRGNVNSVSKDFLEKKLKMSYSPTNDRIRGHKISFAPIGVVDLEFHPVDTNARGESKIDLPITRPFYVHDENDLFGQVLLGREYMESRQDKIGLPTHKVTKKMTPEEQRVANEKIAKRDAASQRVLEANKSGNSPPGNNVGDPSAQQGTNRHGPGT